jgi:hypothetical protein
MLIRSRREASSIELAQSSKAHDKLAPTRTTKNYPSKFNPLSFYNFTPEHLHGVKLFGI